MPVVFTPSVNDRVSDVAVFVHRTVGGVVTCRRVSGKHVVWDWNGTLLDDLGIVIQAANRCLEPFGAGPIDEEDYRDHYTRPVRAFYNSLLSREITEDEWNVLNDTFHDAYFTLAESVSLTSDTLAAFDAVETLGWRQSLLSMSPQLWLDGIVDRFGLRPRLDLVTGLSGPTGGLKAEHLEAHLVELGLDGSNVVMVGDTPDDVAAANHVGATAILYHGGSHHLDLLQRQDVPVAETLVEAVELAVA